MYTKIVVNLLLALMLALPNTTTEAIKYRSSYTLTPAPPVATNSSSSAGQETQRPPWGKGYYNPPPTTRMESGLPPEEEEEDRVPPEGAEYFIDAREQDFIVPEVAVGVDRGVGVGVGVQPGVLCMEGARPMGDDGFGYCRKLTQDDKVRMTRMASGE